MKPSDPHSIRPVVTSSFPSILLISKPISLPPCIHHLPFPPSSSPCTTSGELSPPLFTTGNSVSLPPRRAERRPLLRCCKTTQNKRLTTRGHTTVCPIYWQIVFPTSAPVHIFGDLVYGIVLLALYSLRHSIPVPLLYLTRYLKAKDALRMYRHQKIEN